MVKPSHPPPCVSSWILVNGDFAGPCRTSRCFSLWELALITIQPLILSLSGQNGPNAITSLNKTMANQRLSCGVYPSHLFCLKLTKTDAQAVIVRQGAQKFHGQLVFSTRDQRRALGYIHLRHLFSWTVNQCIQQRRMPLPRALDFPHG